jgi:hypothetical protein
MLILISLQKFERLSWYCLRYGTEKHDGRMASNDILFQVKPVLKDSEMYGQVEV